MSRRHCLAVALLAAVVFPPSLSAQNPSIARRIQQNQARLDSIRQERRQLETQMDRLQGDLRTLTGELQNIERQKSITTRIVNELDRQIGFLNLQVDTVTMELALAEDALAERNAVLQRRIVDIYKRGSLWMFEVLLAAESFGDLLSRYKYLYLVSRQDRALVGQVEELRDRVASQRSQLLALRSENQTRRDERGDELGRYTSLEEQRLRALRQAQASQRVAATRLDSLSRAEQELGSLIESLEEARRRAAAAGAPAEATITTADLGALDWPADGPIAYEYGRYSGPDGTILFRQGIGIRVPEGTPVRTVGAGEVVAVRRLETYGFTVIVDHGAGFMTVYTYLSRPSVAEGAYVQKNAVVGLSGGAASDVGPHFEFQIRERGVHLDPVSWLRARAGR